MENSENKDWYLVKQIPEIENNKELLKIFFGGFIVAFGGYFLAIGMMLAFLNLYNWFDPNWVL